MTTLEDLAEVEEPGAVADPEEGAVGAAQRLRIKVPKVYTQLTMGERLMDEDTQGFALAGFGVVTEGHVFLGAGGVNNVADPNTSAMKLQAAGDISLHSASGGVNIGAKSGAVIGTGGGLSMLADGGVVIAGGDFGAAYLSSDKPLQELSEGMTTPSTPGWVGSMGTVATFFGTAIAAIDAGVGIVSAINDANRTSSALPKDNEGDHSLQAELAKWGGFAGIGFSSIGAAGGLYSMIGPSGEGAGGGLASLVSTAVAGTTIFGQSGLLLGTMVTCGIYSLMGTTIATPAAVSVMGGTVGLQAATTLTQTATDIELGAGRNMAIQATNTLTLGSTEGGIALKAASSSIGMGGAAEDGLRLESAKITMDGVNAFDMVSPVLNINVGKYSASSSTMIGGKDASITTSERTSLTAGDHLGLISGKDLTCDADGGSRMHMGKSTIVLGFGSGSVGDPPAHPIFPERPAIPALGASCEEVDAWWEADLAWQDEVKQMGLDFAADYVRWHKKIKSADVTTGVQVKSSGVKVVASGNVGVDVSSSKVKIFGLEVSK